MKLKFIPLDFDYLPLEGDTYMRVFGKTDAGKRVCLIDKIDNFFYCIANNPKKLAKEVEKIEFVKKVEIMDKKFLESEVKAIRIYSEHNKMTEITHSIKDIDPNTTMRERDISQTTRYITQKNIKPLYWTEVETEKISEELKPLTENLKLDLIFRLQKVIKIDEEKEFTPKVLAFDIECDEFEIGKGRITMISLVTDNFRKVLTWNDVKDSQDYVEGCENEKDMIKRFIRYVEVLDPDIITGYFTDGFDFPYLRSRAEFNGIELRLGVANAKPVFSRGHPLNVSIKGLVHVDLLKFIKTVYSQYMQSESLSLNDVSKELLGEGKKDQDFEKKIPEMTREEVLKFFEYSLHDSVLTYNLFMKVWPDIFEFTRVVKEPLYRVSRQGMSRLVEDYIIHNLERFNEIAEKRPVDSEIGRRRVREKYEGAYVLQPEPNLYEDLAIFDFTSFYPSIIVTFNLSRSTILEKKGRGSLEVDTGGKKFYFSKKEGVVSKLLREIIALRKKYKEELKNNPDPIKKARSNAFKLLANAYYGYQGFFGARYYCPEASASTTAISRDFIKKIIDKMNKEGYKVLYADTDGFAFLLNEKTKEESLKFLEKLNSDLPGIMELELEDFFKRGIWVSTRSGEYGAKKKYAMITHEDKLKIRGFETVRRDWCKLARQVQNKILRMILNTGETKEALEYVKEVIKKLSQGKIDKKELIIKTQLKKAVSEYKSEGPHVAIAKKMEERGMKVNVGMIVQYYVSDISNKKARIRDKAKLPEEKGDYEVEYYVKNQILPAVENIFEVFGIKHSEIIEVNQQKLEEFF